MQSGMQNRGSTDTQIEPVMEPDPKRFIPATFANEFAPAHPDEATRAVRRALE